ncbi:MAG: helix-turn-helix domain-containing protein [Burkholderiaceae bacterium]|nr:helix-turn-helix domain-containing protein [Burkholderiaceae bacterium]
MSVHSRIRNARLRLGLTEQQLADRSGVTRAAVQQWEREGGTAPRRSKQELVAKALGLTVAELMLGQTKASVQSEQAYEQEISTTVSYQIDHAWPFDTVTRDEWINLSVEQKSHIEQSIKLLTGASVPNNMKSRKTA